MNKINIPILISIIAWLISACTYNEGVIQKDNIAYHKIKGDLCNNNISLQIDDDKINKLIAYNFRFFNEKVEGRGKRMDYKDEVLKADNIFYVIKGIDD